MAIRIVTETLNNPLPSKALPIAWFGNVSSGLAIHTNHVVDFTKPLQFRTRAYINDARYDSYHTLNRAFWDSIGISEGNLVAVCWFKSNRYSGFPNTSLYVNGGLCPDIGTGNNSSYNIEEVMVYNAGDVILMSNPHHTVVYDKYSMGRLLMHTAEGQFSETTLNEGYVTNVPGVTTSKVTLRTGAVYAQLEHRARLNKTSANLAESSVKVQIGTKEETRILPLLGAPSTLVESIFIPVVLADEPDNVITDISYTLNLTHQ